MWWPEGSSYHLSAFSLAGRPGCLAIQYACSCKGARARYSELVPGSAVTHTDDIAWEHSRFGWAGLLIDGILMPAHHGQAVRYRPPRWDEHGREGSLQVPAGCPLLIIEGDGAWRRDVAHLIDTLIWVQADEREAGRRAAARAADRPAADLANRAVDGAPFDEDGWMAEEIPFNTAQRTWERAGIIVCGTPEVPYDPSTLVSEATGQPIARTTLADPSGYGLGVQQQTSPQAGTIWDYEGQTIGNRVAHYYFPRSGMIIALAVNSATAPDNDAIGVLAGSVYQTLQNAGA
jgi:hypothetical protein